MPLEVRSVDNLLGTPVSYAYAVKAGPWLFLTGHEAFADYIPPSTSVVMDRVFGGSSTISTSLIAVVAEAGYEIRKVHPPGVASAPTSGFVPAVVCNEFVFVAGQMAHNPGTGLDPRAIVPEHAAWVGIPIRKQTEFLILEKL